MVGRGFSKDMGRMRVILRHWKMLREISEEFGGTNIMFIHGILSGKNIKIVGQM